MPQMLPTSLRAKQPVGADDLAMTEVTAPKNNGRSSASHEYTMVNTGEDPEIYRKKAAEKMWPTEPRRLKDFITFTCIALFWDVLVTPIPVAFLGEYVPLMFP